MKPIKEIQEAKPSKEILGEIAELEGYVKGNISGMEDRYGYYLEYFNDIQELIDNYKKLEEALKNCKKCQGCIAMKEVFKNETN